MNQSAIVRGFGSTLLLGVVLSVSACSIVGGDHVTGARSASAAGSPTSAAGALSTGAAAAPRPAAGAEPLGDATQDWPAVDLGPRVGAEGTASESAPGVYRYLVVANDSEAGLLERFDLCGADIETADDAADGTLSPGETLTIQRSMTDSEGADATEFHRGWKCTYPEQPRTSQAG